MTEVIIGGRATGKTYRLMTELLKDENAIMLCATVTSMVIARQAFVDRLMQELGRTRDHAFIRAQSQIVTPNNLGHRIANSFLIDDAQQVLAALLRCDPQQVAYLADNFLVETPQGKRLDSMGDNPHA